MKKWVVLAGALAVCAVQPGWAADKPADKAVSDTPADKAVAPKAAAGKPADKVMAPKTASKNCAPASAREAEQAIRFLTDLMVVSSVCQDTVYAEFRLRNREAILGYQKAMIQHLRGNAAFDRWNTVLANQVASKQAGNQQLCVQSAAMLQQAKGLDPKGLHAFAVAQATSANPDCK